eukprot:scaffold59257_cov68-Attheya_sp.AAC.1
MMAVLEAARMRSPVNNVNILLNKEKKVAINGKSYTFPPGTETMLSLALASIDPYVFDKPTNFNPARKNLLKATVSFNHVGFKPEGSGAVHTHMDTRDQILLWTPLEPMRPQTRLIYLSMCD